MLQLLSVLFLLTLKTTKLWRWRHQGEIEQVISVNAGVLRWSTPIENLWLSTPAGEKALQVTSGWIKKTRAGPVKWGYWRDGDALLTQRKAASASINLQLQTLLYFDEAPNATLASSLTFYPDVTLSISAPWSEAVLNPHTLAFAVKYFINEIDIPILSNY